MNAEGSGSALAIVHSRADEAIASRLGATLGAAGHLVSYHSMDSEISAEITTVVLLSAALADECGGVDKCTAQLSNRPGALIPVALTGKGSPILSDVSQIPMERLGFDRTASRVELLVRIGPHDLNAWNSASGMAAEWDSDARPDGLLTSRSHALEILALLERPVSELDPDRGELIRRFARASIEDADKRDRRLRRVFLAATAVVSSLGVVALVLALVSTQLSTVARADSDRAKATRLATEASDLIGFDPDLPEVLAAYAAKTDPYAPGVAEVQWNALQATVPHRSTLLPMEVRGFEAWGDHGAIVTESELIPVEFHTDQSPRLGEPVPLPLGAEDIDMCAPAPDGSEVACLGSSGVFTVDLDDPEHLVMLHDGAPEGVTRLGWLDEDTVVAGAESGVFILPRRQGLGWQALPGGRQESVQTLSTSPLGLAVVYSGAFVSYEIDGLTPVVEVEHDGTFFVDAASPDVVVRTYPDRVTVEDSGSDRYFDGTVVGVEVFTSGTVATMTPFGEIRWIFPGVESERRVAAHLGAITHFVKLDDQRLVTLGTDGYLREWFPDTSTPMGIPATALETPGVTDLGEPGSLFAEGAGVRLPQLGGRHPEGDYMLAGFPQGIFASFGFENLLPTEKVVNFIGMGTEPIYLTCDDPQLFGFLAESGVGIFQSTDESFRPGSPIWSGVPEIDTFSSQMRSVAGLSAGCDKVVQADREHLRIWDVVEGETRTEPVVTKIEELGHPVAVLVDGVPAVVTSDGALVDQTGAVTSMAVPVVGADRRGDVLVVASDRGEALIFDGDDDPRTVRLYDGVNPIRVRLSSDGRHAAFIGLTMTQVLSLEMHHTVALVSSGMKAPLTDLVMGPESAVTVSRDLSVGQIRLLDPGDLAMTLRDSSPRSLTEAELDRFGLG